MYALPVKPGRILLIRPSALGDVARTVPVLVSLRRAYPGAKIDWLVQDTFVDVIRSHPDLSEALPFPRSDFSRWFRALQWHRVAHYLHSLLQRQYDLVIDAQGLARSALLAQASGACTRIGHADAREFATLAYTSRVPCDIETHTVDRMLSLAAAAGARPLSGAEAIRLYTPPEAADFHTSVPGRYAVLAPTSRWPAKQWPDDRFASLACTLANDGLHVVLVGGGSERTQVPATLALAATHPRVFDMLGRTSVSQLMNVVEHAALVVANDSAALHIAVGFRRPLVALFGPTRVNRVGPYRRAGDVIQHATSRDRLDHKDPAGRALMERISLSEVTAAARARLG